MILINRCKRCLGSKKIQAMGSLIKDCPECDGTGLKPKEVLPVVKEVKKGGKDGRRKTDDLHA